MGRVMFENSTGGAVTFVKKRANSDPTYLFTLGPNGGTHPYNLVAAGTPGGPCTYDKLQLVEGADANGAGTTVTITTDELDGLEKVIVTRPGVDFHLEKQKRSTFIGRLKQNAADYMGQLFGSHGSSEGSGSRV